MKSLIKTIIVIGVICTAFIEDASGVTTPAGVTVTYALVLKERLPDAVKGKLEALEIEDLWRKEMMSKAGFPPYPRNLASQRYSIVVFVEIPAKFALWGRIGIPIQNPKSPLIVNVNLSPGYKGTYVIDGGGVILMNLPIEPKPFEWLEVHTH